MAMCNCCGREMTRQPVSCAPMPLTMNGRQYELIPWGSETGSRAAFYRAVDGPCDSCNTPRGGVHHPGCCIEQCPVCRDQMFGCDCPFDEFDKFDELDRV